MSIATKCICGASTYCVGVEGVCPKAGKEVPILNKEKPLPVRPSLYAMYYQGLKEIAYKHGYNLCIHGSMNRDFDLVAFPWKATANPVHFEMISEMMAFVGGNLNSGSGKINDLGQVWYGINIWRNKPFTDEKDQQYYLDIKVVPLLNHQFAVNLLEELVGSTEDVGDDIASIQHKAKQFLKRLNTES